MPCSGSYALPWQYASFWCIQSTITGVHGDAGPADVTLSDTQRTFLTNGVRPNEGFILYNTTAGTNGPVTAVTENTLTATGVTWDALDAYRITLLTGLEISTIEHYLDIAVSDIHAALAATGACDCTVAAWATGYLEKLHIIDTAAYSNCPCGTPRFTEDRKNVFLEWAGGQMEALATGKIEICAGETGADFPYRGWAEQGVTEFAQADIIWNDVLRNL